MRLRHVVVILLVMAGVTSAVWFVVDRDRPEEDLVAAALQDLVEHRADIRAGVEPRPLDPDAFTTAFLAAEAKVDAELRERRAADVRRGQALTRPEVALDDLDLDRDGGRWVVTATESVRFDYAQQGFDTGEGYPRRAVLERYDGRWLVASTSTPPSGGLDVTPNVEPESRRTP